MAWCCQETSQYRSQCWPRSASPYGITRPQRLLTYCPLETNFYVIVYQNKKILLKEKAGEYVVCKNISHLFNHQHITQNHNHKIFSLLCGQNMSDHLPACKMPDSLHTIFLYKCTHCLTFGKQQKIVLQHCTVCIPYKYVESYLTPPLQISLNDVSIKRRAHIHICIFLMQMYPRMSSHPERPCLFPPLCVSKLRPPYQPHQELQSTVH